jgi:hypothetical protein
MPAQTSARSREDRSPRPASSDPQLLDLIVAVAIGIAVALFLPHLPRTVDVTVSNPTEFDLTVEATGAHRDGWMPVGIVEAHSTMPIDDVVDQGHTWILRVTGQGVVGGEIRLDRSQLQHDSWRIVIPASIGERIREHGAEPSPP